jgi:hypothetical protein
MKHKVKVIMLPTKDKSCITFDGTKVTFHSHEVWNRKMETPSMQHLYITVSQDIEKIKKGDWCIAMDTNIVFQVNMHEAEKPISQFASIYRKIIATTDRKLTIHTIEEFGFGASLDKYSKIPKPQQSFLKEFIVNPDGEWKVEYRCQELQHYKHHLVGNTCTCKKNTLVLNQDNTVNITSVEEKMIPERLLYIFNDSLPDSNSQMTDVEIKSWIKENL